MEKPVNLTETSRIALTAASLLGFCDWRPAYAGLAHPGSWKQESADGRFVLVMVSPLPLEEDARPGDRHTAEVQAIRAKYRQSGLYRNDGSTKPLWTIQYWDRSEAYIASDGLHLVVADDWYDRRTLHVVTFYRSGTELATHRIDELIPSLHLAMALNGGFMISRDASVFDDQQLRYRVRTNQGETLEFDVTTGRLVEHSSPLPRLAIALLVAFALAMIGLALCWYRVQTIRHRLTT